MDYKLLKEKTYLDLLKENRQILKDAKKVIVKEEEVSEGPVKNRK